MRRCAFDAYHPIVTLAFFVGAIAFSIVMQDLLFQLIGLVAAICLYGSMEHGFSVKLTGGLLVAFLLITVLNPLFSTSGSHVLFMYFGRPYTLEGLMYGVSTAIMFISMIVWFMSFSKILNSERVNYLFGRIAPAVTLVITMILRLIPAYGKRARQSSYARSCIGKEPSSGPVRNRLREGALVLSSLTAWALESSIVMADSMKSRGYGTARPSMYAQFRFKARDGVLLSFMAILIAAIVAGLAFGATTGMSPTALMSFRFGFLDAVTLVMFTIFVMMPFVVNVVGELAWRASVSKT